MKKAGIELIYSIPGIKVHTKIALVTKMSQGKLSIYSLISTGNFNEITARFYTDHTLLTSDKDINEELLALFHFLKKRETPVATNDILFKKLYVAQFNLVEVFHELIDREIKKVKKNGSGLIRLKLNNLEEPGMIDLLCKASKAGVTVRLIIRSICCLVSGVKGSENIQVKRLVGRYLEHTRLFIFGEDKDAQVIIGSSDWMTRNLFYRIELCTPVTDNNARRELLEYFQLQWQETDRAVSPNSNSEIFIDEQSQHSGQLSVYNYLKERV